MIPENFLKKYLVFSLITAVISILPLFLLNNPHLVTGILLNYLLFFILVFLSTLIIFQSIRKKEENIFKNLLVSMTAKMFIAVMVFWILFSYYKDSLIIFTSSFFIYYLVFSIFEVCFLVRYLNKNRQKDSISNMEDENSRQK